MTTPVTGPVPASISILSGDGQLARVGTAVSTPPSVTVRDVNGNPVSGVIVIFAVGLGSGAITGGNATTSSAGIAQVGSWTLGPVVGKNSLTASLSGSNGLSVTFTATANNPLVPATIAVVNGLSQSGSVATFIGPKDPGFRVLDSDGTAVAGVTVTFTPSGDGVVSASTVVTDSLGDALVRWQLGTAPSQQTLRATVGSITTTLTASAQARFLIANGNNQVAAPGSYVGPKDPGVRLTRLDGTPVPGATIQFAPSGNGSVTSSAVTSDANGVALVRWQLAGSPGPNSLTARIGDSVQTLTAQALSPGATLTILAGDGQTAPTMTSVAISPSVIVRDVNGNPVSGVAVTFAVGVGGGSVARATDVTTTDGIATSGSWTLGSLAGGTNSLTASVSGLSGSPVTFTARVSIARIAISTSLQSFPVQITTFVLANGQSSRLVGTLFDTFGTPLTGRTITWTSSAPASVSVSADGTVTGLIENQTSLITAAAEGVSGSITIDVITWSLSPGTASIAVGDSAGIFLVNASGGSPCNVNDPRPTWSSSDSTIATFATFSTAPFDTKNLNGIFLKGKRLGTVTVTATCFAGPGLPQPHASGTYTIGAIGGVRLSASRRGNRSAPELWIKQPIRLADPLARRYY